MTAETARSPVNPGGPEPATPTGPRGTRPVGTPRHESGSAAYDLTALGGPAELRGALDVESGSDGLRIHRLPAFARAQVPDDFLRVCAEQPSGVRLALRTDATRLELDVRAHRVQSINRPPDGRDGPRPEPGRYDLRLDGALAGHGVADAHGLIRLDFDARRASASRAPVTTVSFDLPGRDAEVEIWLPYGEVTTIVALRADAPIRPPGSAPGPRWIHHGSSISHGACADGPTGIWPVVAAAELGWDLVNLGFSGNAVLDPFVAQAIRREVADVISLKIGINIVNHDLMRRRLLAPLMDGFLDTIRDGHPDTPIVLISPILCPMVEDRPGPTLIDPTAPPDAPRFVTLGRPEELAADKLSLAVIREELAAVVARRRAAGDRALIYLDGLELYGEPEWAAMPMADLLHPDGPAQRHMGERFAARAPALLAESGLPIPRDGHRPSASVD